MDFTVSFTGLARSEWEKRENSRMNGGLFGLIATALLYGPLPESAALHPGQPAPAWSNLIGTDGALHALADLKEKAAIVVVFFSNNCPDSLEYEDRLLALARDYADKEVALVFVNVSLLPEDDMPRMVERARRKKYPFPYLFDPSQHIGVAYAARVTPTVFVLDRSRKLAYRGAFDDNFKPERVRHGYVREALDALLSGSRITTPETDALGCDIDYQSAAS